MANATPKKQSTKSAPKSKKTKDAFRIEKRKDGRYAVKTAKGKSVNGAEKVAILAEKGLIKVLKKKEAAES